MRSDAYIRVTCDKCGNEEEVELTALARNSYDERDVDAKLKRLGWCVTDAGDYCGADCAAAAVVDYDER